MVVPKINVYYENNATADLGWVLVAMQVSDTAVSRRILAQSVSRSERLPCATAQTRGAQQHLNSYDLERVIPFY